MQKYSPLRIIIFSVILIVIAYLAYVFFLKEIILNNSSRTIHVESLSSEKTFNLTKHASQGNIYSLELEIKGKSDRNLSFGFGPEKNNSMTQVSVKKGEVDFVYAGDWYHDSCYLIIPSDPAWKGKLDVTYRFISTK